MTEESIISKVKSICKKKPNDRSQADILDLQDLTSTSKVFKNIIDLSGEMAHQICCKFLSYEYCPADSYLFKLGDSGSCFYTIISGKVGIEIPKKSEITGEVHMVEVVELGKGGSFGELALESSKPRAASAKCKTNSHFVTLDKADYNRMIAKVVRDKRNNIVNFLKTLPLFSSITKGSLAKLTYNFKEKELYKGQVVYKEGDVVSDVFLVLEGEFVFQKKIVVEDGRKKNAMYAETYTDSVEILKRRSKGLDKKLVQTGTVAKIGIGEIFGVEEKNEEFRRFTCICSSYKAKVLHLQKADFYKRIKGEDTIFHIQDKIEIKEKEIEHRVAMWKFIAENTANSLSPLQKRKRNNEIETVLRERRTPTPPKKSSTVQCFSKKQDNFPNIFLYRLVDNEMKKPILEKHKKIVMGVESGKSTGAIPVVTNSKIQLLEKGLKAEVQKSRALSPITGSGYVTMYSMNSKAIYNVLK